MKVVNSIEDLPKRFLELLRLFGKTPDGVTHIRAYNVPRARKKSGFMYAKKGIVYNICPFYHYKKGILDA